ncbi:hypothetical protein [Streptomyces sp. NPDC089919]|uniref:hypothetical protein n=1 Tax=Streptomyces sp. NPDC089919 TaxID=3155188 RepID=UPI003433F15E
MMGFRTMRVKVGGAAALLTVPVLLFAAGCSSGGDGGPAAAPEGKGAEAPATSGATPGPSSGPSAGSPAGATRAPGTPLERAALVQGDLPGYQISAQAKNPAAPDGQPQADKKACQPLADVMGDKPDPAAGETVNRGIGSQKQLGLAVSASLSTYSEAGAEQLLARLRRAVRACGDGFTAAIQQQSGTYRDVRPAPYAVGGDESVSWTTTATAEGVSAPIHVVVVRKGPTVIRLMALNVAAASKPAQVPHEVADRQVAKVAAGR